MEEDHAQPAATSAPKPIAFMVMPFGKKPVVPPVDGMPAEIDFDALWNLGLEPALRRLGYDAVRADQDAGALIIHEMLERLFFSDIVVADMTIANANVYYEVGIRHAARPTGCVLVAADWSKPLFDVLQMRRIAYPLTAGSIDEAAAQVIADRIVKEMPALVDGDSPMNAALPGYPNPDPRRAVSIRRELSRQATFSSQLQSIRSVVDDGQRSAAATALAGARPAAFERSPAVAAEMVMLLRDCLGWQAVADYVRALPARLAGDGFIREQAALALSHVGDPHSSIGALEQLIADGGETSERRGLLGGRYKRLAMAAKKAGKLRDYQRYLSESIRQYELGMMRDLQDYFSVSNLARLYRERGDREDPERARFAEQLTVISCEALKARGQGNEWLRPTLLATAFDSRNLARAEELAREVEREGWALWKLDSVLGDLRLAVSQIQSEDDRAAFAKVLASLEALVVPAP